MNFRMTFITALLCKVGAIAVSQHEQIWHFSPSLPWTDEGYKIVIAPEFEDLAGNRPHSLFDRSIFDRVNPDKVVPISLTLRAK